VRRTLPEKDREKSLNLLKPPQGFQGKQGNGKRGVSLIGFPRESKRKINRRGRTKVYFQWEETQRVTYTNAPGSTRARKKGGGGSKKKETIVFPGSLTGREDNQPICPGLDRKKL